MTAQRVLRVASIALGIALLLLVLGGIAIYLWLRTSLPQRDGTLSVTGLHHPVTVTRDRNDIPSLQAGDAHDAVFALGFLHAQDRIFQMDMLRRYGAGQLAELGGAKLLDRDRFMRTLGLAHAAELQLAHLPPDIREMLQAYDHSRWQWGALHPAVFSSPVLADVPVLGALLRLSVPAPGANSTVNAGIMTFSSEQHPFRAIGGPSLRMVLDFSNLPASLFMFAPGVSGNPLSAHYGDLTQPWREVEWIAFSRMKAVHTLTLTPALQSAAPPQ